MLSNQINNCGINMDVNQINTQQHYSHNGNHSLEAKQGDHNPHFQLKPYNFF